MQIAIQANEQGHPVVMEFKDGRFKAVDSERWSDILIQFGISEFQALVPVKCDGQTKEPTTNDPN